MDIIGEDGQVAIPYYQFDKHIEEQTFPCYFKFDDGYVVLMEPPQKNLAIGRGDIFAITIDTNRNRNIASKPDSKPADQYTSCLSGSTWTKLARKGAGLAT